MAWDFSTEPEFEEKLAWMRGFVREEVFPLETLDLTYEQVKVAVRPLQEQVKSEGLWAAHLPPALGGMGFGQVRLGLMHEILGQSPLAPVVFGNNAPDSGNAELLAVGMEMSGDESHREVWLQPLLDGELRSAFSMTEPNTAGSDPTLLTTSAVRDGDEWVINGAKLYITNGTQADWLCLLARTSDEPGARGMSLIVVPTDIDGVVVSRKLEKLGMWSSDTAELSFSDVRVPVAHTIGEVGRGFQQQMVQFQAERLTTFYKQVGSIELALEKTAAYVRERHAFGGARSRTVAQRYSPVPLSLRVDAMAWMSRSRRITYSSPCTSTSKRSSGLNRTVSPTLTVRTCGPTATASAQVSRRLIWAVAGIRMPARERRSPSVGEICTMTRSKSTVMGCLSSALPALACPAPFLVVDDGTLARYRTPAAFQVSAPTRRQAGRTRTPCSAM